jgi:t-SNARE complex subunit (syntaxin)
MLRPRKEPDPLQGRRKLIAEQERLLAERMTKLHEKLARGGEEEDPNVPPKPPELPVWRLEEDVQRLPRHEAPAVNKRVLNRQRRNDQILFCIMMVALVVVVLLVLALAHSHLPGSIAGS